MTIHADTPFLAVDGGGTRCRIALTDARGAVQHIEVGSANVSSDFDAATAEILTGLRALARRAGLSDEQLAALPAYLGLAGITGPEIAARLAAALPFEHVRIEDDRPAALHGALGGADGMVAHCGTGSFIAMQSGSTMRFVGGWGPVLGDPASAQWVGRQALARSLDVVDGLAPDTPLAQHILTKLDGPAGVVRFAAKATPRDFGDLAPEVTRLAAENCPLAREILQDAADQIAATLSKLGWQPATPICLTGGIGPHFAAYLPAQMQQATRPPKGVPLDGAIALARDFAAGIPPSHTPHNHKEPRHV